MNQAIRMRIVVAAILMLALIAEGLSLWLAYHAGVAGPLAGCTDTAVFACDAVLGSRWSTWLGIPVAAFGVINYGLVTAAAIWLLARPNGNRAARVILIPTAVAAASAGLWFTGLQLVAIQKFCPYCMLTHGCGLMIASLVIAQQWLAARQPNAQTTGQMPSSLGGITRLPPTPQSQSQRLSSLGLVGLGLSAIACLVVGQIAYRPPQLIVTEIDTATEAFSPSDLSVIDDPAPTEVVTTQKTPAGGDRPRAAVAPTEVAPTETVSAIGPSDLVVAIDDLSINSEPTGPMNLGQPSINNLSRSPRVSVPREGPLAVQSLVQQAPTDPNSEAPIIAVKGAPPLYRADVILLGNPDAEFVMVELLDYTCIACRLTHPRVAAARREFGDRLAVALIPISMERKCNPLLNYDMAAHRNACKLARLSLAFWELAPEQYEVLHEWLIQTDSFQDYSAVWEFASGLVGTDQLIAAISSERIEQQLARNIGYWSLFGKRLPTLLIGRKAIQGQLESDSQLIELIRGQTNLP